MNVSKIENNANFPPKKTSAVEILLKTNPSHPIAQKYQEKWEEYQKSQQESINQQVERVKPKELPELKPIDPESLFRLFKQVFQYLHKVPFDENANNGEGRIFARTLCYYFLGMRVFLKSPLINADASIPSMSKGLMVIGGKGIGKTSIMKTFYWIFFNAFSKGLKVLDIEGTEQFLARYKRHFSYYTANDVVNDYERCNTHEEKDRFWNEHKKGKRYYDDVMSERVGSNYGKIDLFRDIFENRYNKRTTTMISLNYVGEIGDLQQTLEAFAERYGDRVFDRMFEMFNILEMKGESLRK